jgi:hypothetical protein
MMSAVPANTRKLIQGRRNQDSQHAGRGQHHHHALDWFLHPCHYYKSDVEFAAPAASRPPLSAGATAVKSWYSMA